VGRLTATASLVLALVVLVAGACGTSSGAEGHPERDGGVDVAAELDTSNGSPVLRVTMTPQRAGFHLYSTDLDRTQTGGLGVPTEIEPTTGLTADGAITASLPDHALHNEALDVDLPVYPEGPVTFEVPVRETGDGDTATVTVTYGACSASVCLPVVRARSITVDL
jgi:hypothetical protein